MSIFLLRIIFACVLGAHVMLHVACPSPENYTAVSSTGTQPDPPPPPPPPPQGFLEAMAAIGIDINNLSNHTRKLLLNAYENNVRDEALLKFIAAQTVINSDAREQNFLAVLKWGQQWGVGTDSDIYKSLFALSAITKLDYDKKAILPFLDTLCSGKINSRGWTDQKKGELYKWILDYFKNPIHAKNWFFVKNAAEAQDREFLIYVAPKINEFNRVGFEKIAAGNVGDKWREVVDVGALIVNDPQDILFENLTTSFNMDIARYNYILSVNNGEAQAALGYLFSTGENYPPEIFAPASLRMQFGELFGKALNHCFQVRAQKTINGVVFDLANCLQQASLVITPNTLNVFKDLAGYKLAPPRCPLAERIPAACAGNNAKFFNPRQNAVRINISGYGLCSGSFISKRHIATAAHCFLKDAYGDFTSANLLAHDPIDPVQGYVKINFPATQVEMANCAGDPVTLAVQGIYIPYDVLQGREELDFALLVVGEDAPPNTQIARMYQKSYDNAGDKNPDGFGAPTEIRGYPAAKANNKWIVETSMVSGAFLNTLPRPQAAKDELKEDTVYTRGVGGLFSIDANSASFSGGPIYQNFGPNCELLIGTVRNSDCIRSDDAGCVTGTSFGFDQMENFIRRIIAVDGQGLMVHDLKNLANVKAGIEIK